MKQLLLPGPRFTRFDAAPRTTPLAGELHVIRGDSAGGALKSAGAGSIIPVPDTLASGPSARTWSVHAVARERYWRLVYAVTHPGVMLTDTMGGWNPSKTWGADFSLLGREGFIAKLTTADPHSVTIWSSGTWNDLLFMAWALDALRRSEMEVRLAGDLRSTMPLGWLNPEQLVPLARKTAKLPDDLRAALRDLWLAFTEPTPDALEELRRSPPPSLPSLRRGLAVHAALLPRAMRRTRGLRVSVVDEVLLRLFSPRRLKRFPDLFKGASPSRARWPRSGLYAMLTHFGEVFIEWRIAAWVKAGAVEQVETGPSEASRYTRAWRLTERGQEILSGGLERVGDAPEMRVGGYSSRRAKWCCIVGNAGWRFAPH